MLRSSAISFCVLSASLFLLEGLSLRKKSCGVIFSWSRRVCTYGDESGIFDATVHIFFDDFAAFFD
jgi:hypothetical protein